MLSFTIPLSSFASYDDSGITGHKSAYLLEEGIYSFYVGNNVRDAVEAGNFLLFDPMIIEQLSECLAPVEDDKRMVCHTNTRGSFAITDEPMPLRTVSPTEKRNFNLPCATPYTGDCSYKLADVANETISMDTFLAQLTDEELSCLIHGEGMCSPRVTPGTAAAFGGVTDRLAYYGIPCACCADGPSGMRFDCGTKAFSLPNGTLLACTFNTTLVKELFTLVGMEMAYHKVDSLLGPGINIHRNPLNGRNFEYFSEDPLLTGKMAAAQLQGMHQSGVTGTIKHFCANNQENGRSTSDSIVSERALREIYLKGFEIAVKEGNALSIMTSYGAINGIWCAGNYDLNTSILREEWGFKGIVMTDWWAKMNDEGETASASNFAAMARAQNDIYMVCSNCDIGMHDDNTLHNLQEGTLTRGELVRNAANICNYLITTNAFKRLIGVDSEITITNREEEEISLDTNSVEYQILEDTLTIPLETQSTKKGDSFLIALDAKQLGEYEFKVTGKSAASELAQIPITIYYGTIPNYAISFSGTNNEWVSKSIHVNIYQRYTLLRVEFMQSGLELKEIYIQRQS